MEYSEFEQELTNNSKKINEEITGNQAKDFYKYMFLYGIIVRMEPKNEFNSNYWWKRNNV